MPSEQTNEVTREEWRDLGFHYDYDSSTLRWILTGSRAGLLKFRDLLFAYSRDPRNEMLSEHEHYGPYMYLKIITWNTAIIKSDAIYGSRADIARLESIVEHHLSQCGIGDTFVIDNEYAPANEAVIELRVENDGFDPVCADTCLINTNTQKEIEPPL